MLPYQRIDCADLDQFAEALQHDGVEMIKLHQGEDGDRIELVQLPGLLLRYGTHGSHFHCVGETFQDHVTFVVPRGYDERMRYLGMAMGSDGVLFQGPGEEHHSIAPSGGFLYLPVPLAPFMEQARHLLGEELPWRTTGLRLDAAEAGTQDVHRFVDALLERVRQGCEAQEAEDLEDRLLRLLTRLWEPSTEQLPQECHAERLARFQRARDWIMDHLDQRFRLHELCAAVGLAERTLRDLFQEFAGMAPIPYIRCLRLHRAHRLLKTSTPDGMSVKYAALDSGFLELGRFSGQYRALFGELPSQTLQT